MLNSILLAIFACNCIFHIATDENVITKLKEIVKKYKNIHPTLLTNLFIEFHEKYNIIDVKFNDENTLADHIHGLDSSIDKNDVINLYKYYDEQMSYLKQVQSKNKLVIYLHKNQKSSCLDRSSLLEEFYATHSLTKNDVATYNDFKTYMMGIDYRIEESVLRMIYPNIFEYQNFIDREPYKKALVSVIAPPQKKTNEIKTEMNNFLTHYRMVSKDVSQLRTFRRLFYEVDFRASDVESKNLHPHVKKYTSVQEMKNIRERLMAKIDSYLSIQSYELKFEMKKFFSVYDLLDADIINKDNFKSIIIAKDDTATPQELDKLHPYIIKYIQYSYKINVRSSLIDFLKRNYELTILDISIHMEQLFATYNLFDFIIENSENLKEAMFNQDRVTSEAEADIIYTIYLKYQSYIDLEFFKYRALVLIRRKNKENIFFFAEAIKSIVFEYKIYEYGVSRLANFIKYMKEKNPLITDSEAEILHPYVLRFMDYERKKLAYDELSSCIEIKNILKPCLPVLLKKVIYVLGIKEPHFSSFNKFSTVIGEIHETPDADIMKQVFDELVSYRNSKDEENFLPELNPGDIDIDGTIVPPFSGRELTWYNFFRFFGARPHVVQGVYNLKDLSAAKRWFDDFYKDHTGIHYYIFDPLVKRGLSVVSKSTQNLVSIPARASI